MGFVSLVVVLYLIYVFILVVYRVWFSPVAHIPGPLLARATYWYEFYYDVVLNGQYTFKVRDFHKRYGPIIRVNPHEVHIHDPNFFDEIYAGPLKKRDRWDWATKSFDLKESMTTASTHDDHRRKRAPFYQYFSTAKVRSLQQDIETVIFRLLTKFEQYKLDKQPMPLDSALFALSNDAVMRYTFGTSYDRVSAPGFNPSFMRDSMTAMQKAHIMKHLPIVASLVKVIPESYLKAKVPEMAGYLQLQEDIKQEVIQARSHSANNSQKGQQTSIFYELVATESNPLINSFDYLWQNGVTIILGATNTTAETLFTTIFHLLQNPGYARRLREEFATLSAHGQDGNQQSLSRIESLEYLTAVVKEGLRMSGTVTTRLQRIDAKLPIVYTDSRGESMKSYTLPAGTPVSSTVFLIHHDPVYYPDPYKFKPERWLAESGNTPPPEKHFVPFLKGTSQCIGINFAYAEIFLVLYHLFKPGSYGCEGAQMEGDRGCLELFETTFRDIEIVGDGLGPIYRSDSRGVRILIK